jgi:hypothetical protein
MPTYTFKNKETGELTEVVMKIAELDSYREANPHLETVISAPMLGDPTKLSASRKYDSGFKEVLQRIHEKTPGSQLNKSSSQL